VLRADVTAPGSALLVIQSRCVRCRGRRRVQGRCIRWGGPKRLARCGWEANWTLMMRCSADATLSKQQSRQFSATACTRN